MNDSNDNRIQIIRERLEAALSPEQIHIRDDSHLHVGHPGARDGRGHFHVHIIASAFQGQKTLARHRMVFDALGELMETDIHALQIDAQTPDNS
ncbi:BolA family protein [Natronospira bacteriovora]|uniref:BolA family protein n=1 Tax=Natronospira bacteriovora TaxID=3069753 RepID=A0ABU0W568_9GAMM|nr:BolA family protein [Natronospira sp. AB-CW4]MDQ2069159.1 BolA family protein [Natronospira sp. AB-CW4]